MVKKVLDPNFWRRKKVFITGHTGFKGTWLALWLHALHADVSGYALEPPTHPSLYRMCELDKLVHSTIGDIRDQEKLYAALLRADPEIVFHLAAQPLVLDSYANPLETYDVNVMGTVHLLEAVRKAVVLENRRIKAVIVVTSDKCYENREWEFGYSEDDQLGGHDPYSSSKACAELVVAAYRKSYFHADSAVLSQVSLASVRAGNVIGGGDWAKDRLIPDCIRARLSGAILHIRNPHSIRPWQHVLEPLSGYMQLAQRMVEREGGYAGAWNFGPEQEDARTVEWLVARLHAKWEGAFSYKTVPLTHQPHEAHYLRLDCTKAQNELRWRPQWNLDRALDKIVEWVRGYEKNQDARSLCLGQIHEFMNRHEILKERLS